MDPVIGLFESYAAKEVQDPHEFARAFHGYMMTLSWAGGMLEAVTRPVLGERTPDFKGMLTSMYWTMGLGFLGWQTLAPLLSSGLQPPLERYYSRLYRPARFTPAQTMDIFALGQKDSNWLRDELRDQGWRDQDLDLWLKLAYRTLSEGHLWTLYENGALGKSDMDKRLRALGYSPEDIPLLYKANEKEETKDSTRYLLSTLKESYLEGRLGEDELRGILASMNFAPREIDLQVANLQTQRAEGARALTTGQVKNLYDNRVLGRDETIHQLRMLDYGEQVAAQLVQAWDNAALPKAARINKSTILEGYTNGSLTRNEALELLRVEAGYPPDKAELLVKIEEASVALKVMPPTVKAVGLALLADFVSAGMITRADLEARSELARYSAADRTRIIDLMFLGAQVTVGVVEVSESLLLDAYVYGVITREALLARLTARGYSADDAELIAATVEAANPDIFGGGPPQLLKQPSVGALQLALQRGLFDEAAFRDKMAAQGFSADAVEIFLFNAQYQAPPEPKLLTKADIMKLLKLSVINRAEAVRRLLQAGYTTVDVELLIRAEGLTIDDTEAAEWFVAGLIDELTFSTIVTEEGFTAEEIEDFLTRYAAGEVG
jgi:hypothetical protein